MNLLKSSILSSISTAVSFISGFVLIKVVASQIGPGGIALVGQFQNAVAIFALIGSLAINSGVVRAIANSQGDEAMIRKVFNNAIGLVLVVSLVLSAGIAIGSRFLATSIFKDERYWVVFAIYASMLSILSVNSIITSFYNGRQKIKTLTLVNIASSLIGVFFSVVMALKWGVFGALIASNFTTFSLFVINIFILRKMNVALFKVRVFKEFDRPVIKGFLAFTFMNIASGILTPITQFFVRGRIINEFDTRQAGYWQGVTRISDYYLQFITTVLGVYYLPKLASLKNDGEIRTEVRKGYAIVLPAVSLLALLIWIFRKWIILVLFSKEFLPMDKFFTYQLLGDFFKIASWIVSYIMIAKSMTKMFILTEVAFSVMFIISSSLLITYYGPIGATYSFCLSYFLYMAMMLFNFRKYLL